MLGGLDDLDDLFPTQTQDSQTATLSQDLMDLPSKMPWGRLYSCASWLYPVDLIEDRFKVGRAEDCDVIITQSMLPPNRVNRFTNISKFHFVITRHSDTLIFITDLSKNGTFINENLIGRNNRHALENDDVISIGYKNWPAYIFKTITSATENDNYLPMQLRKTYLVSRWLGRGACGEVRRVFHKSTGKSYAIKKILKSKSNEFCLNGPKMIDTETEILKSVSHPLVMGMKEIIEADDAFYLVLDFMPGGELTNRILSEQPLSEFQAKCLFYQIALAVQYLHKKKITHRDLKPENVLLSSDSDDAIIKVSDFGLSKIIHNDTIMVTQCGTPTYVAPEVLRGSVMAYDQKVDVWSLGVMLYVMLSKELPFVAKVKEELYKKIWKAEYNFNNPRWARISKEAKDLITRMLTVIPGKRPRIDDVLMHPWVAHDKKMISSVKLLVDRYMHQNKECSYESYDEFEIPPKRTRLS